MEQKVLKLFIEYARGFLSALEELAVAESTSKTLEAEKKPVQQPTGAPSKTDTKKDKQGGNAESSGGIPAAEELANLTFNDLRSLGAKLGVKSGGRRSEIEANILALADKKTAAKTEAPEEDIPPKTETKKEEASKPSDDGEEEEADEDEIREACEKMTDEELQEVLKDVGLRTSGKRTALIDRIIKAVADGILDWEDDGEPVELESEPPDEESGGSGAENRDMYSEFPELAVNDPSKFRITEERLKKLEELDALRESDEEGEDEGAMDEFLAGHFGSKYKADGHDLGQKARLYYEVMKLFVDDDGDEHTEREGYYILDELYCCAKPVDKDGKCLVCNDVYEIGEEE